MKKMTFTLTSVRKRFLNQLSDGEWHRKFPDIGTRTFAQMLRLGFIRVRPVRNPTPEEGPNAIEAAITDRGRKLRRTEKCVVRNVPVKNQQYPRTYATFPSG